MTTTQLVSSAPNITETFLRRLAARVDVPSERPSIEILSPFTEEVFASVPEANTSHLGLNFSVWTSDTDQGVDIASRLEAGTVGANDGYAATWSSYDAPMGGMKAFAPFPGMDYPRYLKVLGPLLKVLKRAPFYK